MNYSVEFKKSSVLRRIGSTVFDGIIVLILFVVLYNFVVFPITRNVSDYDKQQDTYIALMTDTRLYVEEEKTKSLITITSNYDENLTYFYTTYDSIDTYNKKKNDATNYFTYVEETKTYEEKGTDEEMETWYKEVLKDAITNVLAKNEDIIKVSSKINGYFYIMLFASLLPSLLLCVLLPSLLLEGGKTLGMKMMYLKVASLKGQPQPTKLQIIFRFFVMTIAEILLSITTLGLPILLSVLMIIFTKNRQSIVDLTTSTIVVDYTPSKKAILPGESIVCTYFDNTKEKEENTDLNNIDETDKLMNGNEEKTVESEENNDGKNE